MNVYKLISFMDMLSAIINLRIIPDKAICHHEKE